MCYGLYLKPEVSRNPASNEVLTEIKELNREKRFRLTNGVYKHCKIELLMMVK